MKLQLTTLLAITVFARAATAAPQMYDFKDPNPKTVNNAKFKLVAPKETIEGNANGISGTVTFDPTNPAATKGKIVVDGKSLTVPNGMMKQHLQSPTWVDVAKYPEITFEIKELKNVKTEADTTTADAVGMFTLKDVSKELTMPVTLNYKPGKLADREPGKQGDLLVVKTSFDIKRSDYNVNAHNGEDKVADKIELTLGVVGSAAK